MYKRFIAAFMAMASVCANTYAVDFKDWFEDKTLRIDFVFTGNAHENKVSVSGLVSFPTWAGRRANLLECGPMGNAYVLVKDRATGERLYIQAFSSLMQEWTLTDEAGRASRSFETPVLIPFPKNEVVVDVCFRDDYGDYVKLYSQTVNPDDILIKDVSGKTVTKHDYIMRNGSYSECIDIVLVPEGYAASDKNKWVADAEKVKKALFSHNPFDSYADRFNVIRLDTLSHDSGVSVPGKDLWKSTLLDSHFDTFYSPRYLTTSEMRRLHTLLECIPYEQIVIVANSATYGGGGIYNYYMLTSDLDNFPQVMVHEFAHSFAGLGDEYYYDNDISLSLYHKGVEPWEPNLTTLADFDSKWADMIDEDTAIPTQGDGDGEVGVYEGGGYAKNGVYRPVYDDCRMKNNTSQRFCPVCERSIIRMIETLTNK